MDDFNVNTDWQNSTVVWGSGAYVVPVLLRLYTGITIQDPPITNPPGNPPGGNNNQQTPPNNNTSSNNSSGSGDTILIIVVLVLFAWLALAILRGIGRAFKI